MSSKPGLHSKTQLKDKTNNNKPKTFKSVFDSLLLFGNYLVGVGILCEIMYC